VVVEQFLCHLLLLHHHHQVHQKQVNSLTTRKERATANIHDRKIKSNLGSRRHVGKEKFHRGPIKVVVENVIDSGHPLIIAIEKRRGTAGT
jgi:hypothetical protein